MLKTEPAMYKVVGRQNNHLWLEVLEGDDQGIRVSVPVRDPEYEETVQQKALELSVGVEGEFVLESTDERRPEWRIHDVCGIEDDADAVAV